MEWLDQLFLGNTTKVWLVAVVTGLLVWFGLALAQGFTLGKLEKFAPGSQTLLDDLVLQLLRATRTFFILSLAVFVASLGLSLPDRTRLIVERAFFLILLFQGARWGNLVIAFWIEKHLKRRASVDAAGATTLGLISFAIKGFFLVVVVLLGLNNLGVNITALIAGLGVGGIAVALALQNILSDLFASLTIVLDKPFIVGDFVVVGEYSGTIEHIGLKTTRVRSLSGEQLVFSNNDLLQSRIRNYKRMHERRVVYTLGVTYRTERAQLEKIPGMIRGIVEKTPGTRFDRCHFLKFGAYSLDFEVVYWVLNGDFNVYADIAHQINLTTYARFSEEKIDFAFPSQTLFVEQSTTPDRAPNPLADTVRD
jgi:small-conductance mechanosensitive channel